MSITEGEHGTDITVDGVMWVGIISLGGGVWVAYKQGDAERVLKLVAEDEAIE